MKISVVCLSLLMSVVSQASTSDAKLMKVILSSGAAIGACTSNFCVAKITNVECVVVYSDEASACKTGSKVFAHGLEANALFSILKSKGGELVLGKDGSEISANVVTC